MAIRSKGRKQFKSVKRSNRTVEGLKWSESESEIENKVATSAIYTDVIDRWKNP